MDAFELFRKLAELHNNSTAATGEGIPLNGLQVNFIDGDGNKTQLNGLSVEGGEIQLFNY